MLSFDSGVHGDAVAINDINYIQLLFIIRLDIKEQKEPTDPWTTPIKHNLMRPLVFSFPFLCKTQNFLPEEKQRLVYCDPDLMLPEFLSPI